LPRVTEAPDEADDEGCAVVDPAAAGITLDTSAAADATTVGAGVDALDVAGVELAVVVVEVVDAGLDAVDAGLEVFVAPVAAPVVWPVAAFRGSEVCATGVLAADAGAGGAEKRMNAANRSISFWKLADGLAVFSDSIGVLSFGVTLNWQAGSLSRSF
jgi:hypothetical protein